VLNQCTFNVSELVFIAYAFGDYELSPFGGSTPPVKYACSASSFPACSSAVSACRHLP